MSRVKLGQLQNGHALFKLPSKRPFLHARIRPIGILTDERPIRIVQFQRLYRGPLRLGHRFRGRIVNIGGRVITVGEACVCRSVGRIECQRLMKIGDCLLDGFQQHRKEEPEQRVLRFGGRQEQQTDHQQYRVPFFVPADDAKVKYCREQKEKVCRLIHVEGI